jgi:metal-responsive CopG/Arc/MetJ family transcriptional regulator
MTALSIIVPDELAADSLSIAKQMHISRSQFIRVAIENEIRAYKLQKEQSRMLAGFKTLKKQPDYLVETHEIEALDAPLPEEKDNWWTE